MKLSEVMEFADSIKEAVSSLFNSLDGKIEGYMKIVQDRFAALDSSLSKFVTAEHIEEAIRLYEEREAQFFASLFDEKSASMSKGVQIKSVAGDGGTLMVEYTDGRIDEIEIPVIPGPSGPSGADGVNGKDGKDGQDGQDGTPGESGADGKNGADGRDGRDGVDGVGIKSVETKEGEFSIYLTSGEEYRVELPKPPAPSNPRDPVDVKDAMQDKDGHLVLVFSDGTTKDVGRVAGRDGSDGINGVNGLDGATGERGLPGLDGRDGIDGRDGRDGLGFDDMTVSLQPDNRTVSFLFQRDDTIKEFLVKFPVMLFRGAYQSDSVYDAGDVVSFNGSTFHANREVIGEVPGSSDAWTQQTQAGRSIRGERGIPGKDGKNGLNGRDFTPRS